MSALQEHVAAARLDWIVPEWSAPQAVHALVTTRNGGGSRGDRATMDVGPARLDELDEAARARVIANRRRLQRFLPAPPVWLEQVHGIDVVVVDATNLAELRATPPAADAAVTRVREVPLAVRVAECLPVLLCDDAASVIGVAHAGWRGLAGGVVEATLARMDVDASCVHAWLGPAIGPDAFEVGDDVRDAFRSRNAADEAWFRPHANGKWLADLRALARARLRRAGVRSVAGLDACTFADAARFFSWRRDRSAGRLAALAWLSGADRPALATMLGPRSTPSPSR